MKIDNKDFWEKENIIITQEVLKKASDFEMFMFKNVKIRNPEIATIKVFGCGTGREIESIADFFKPSKIVASDISENMIIKCKENLKLWKIDDITTTVVGNAVDYTKPENAFDLVTILNSMLTYVPQKKDRISIFKNAFHVLKTNGVLIGTVHNQIGSTPKTLYFKFRSIFSFILADKVGNRNTGFNGFSVPGYYYSKSVLEKDLKNSGFKAIEIYSLEEYYKSIGITYNRKKGYNNLIFMAQK